MQRNTGCQHLDHALSRRGFLGGSLAGGALGLVTPARAEQLQRDQKRVLLMYLQGGVSQLESWDPKPGTRYGGPFRAISTSAPGVQICELLPHLAQRMHHFSIIRGLNIKTNSHQQGRLFMEMGRRNGVFPYMGSVAAKYLAPASSPLPGFLHITTRGLSDNTSAFLGARYAQLKLTGTSAPDNLSPPDGLAAEALQRREDLRRRLSARFAGRGGQPAFTETYQASFEAAQQLMERKGLLSASPQPQDLERYGTHDFARNCILTRELFDHGATCVKVTHHGYDTHAENFNFHLEQLAEFDRPCCMLLDDLEDRGLLESTLVLIYSEFGRTPKINQRYGRDHWGTAWSVAVGGCGIKRGAVVGATNDEGTEVVDREVDGGHVFHTCFQALGLDTGAYHDVPGKTIPIGDPIASPIEELLA